MPRVRLDAGGLKIAKSGHDVDTASQANMLFDSGSGVAGRIFMTGTVTPATSNLNGLSRQARINFGKTFDHPPVVWAAGIRTDGGADVTQKVLRITPTSGTAYILPWWQVEVDTTGFWFRYAWETAAGAEYGPRMHSTTTWRYWVIEYLINS